MKKHSSEFFDYNNVPIALCSYSLQKRKANQVRLFLYLKSISNGYIKNKHEIYSKAAKELGVCIKTIMNHRKWLIREGWLIPDFTANSMRIVSFEIVVRKLNLQSATGVLIYRSDLKDYKNIAIAAVVKYNLMRPKRRRREMELKMWSSQSHEFPPYPHLPNSVLARIVGTSKTTASRYKRQSKKGAYLETSKRFEDLGIPGTEILNLKRYGQFQPERLRVIRNKVFLRLPDEVRCNLQFRRKYNLRAVCRKNRMEKNVPVKCGYI
jgi:hypothetical protein